MQELIYNSGHEQVKISVRRAPTNTIFPYQDWKVTAIGPTSNSLLAVLGNKEQAIEVAVLLGAVE